MGIVHTYRTTETLNGYEALKTVRVKTSSDKPDLSDIEIVRYLNELLQLRSLCYFPNSLCFAR